MLHSAVLVNRQGALLAARFYDGSGAAARLDWLQQLHKNFGSVIPTTRDGIQLATIREKTVVYMGSGDVVIFVAGSGDLDEIELSALLETLHGALTAALHSQYGLAESKLLSSFPRVSLVLDGFATTGVANTLDPVALKRSTKWAD